MMSPFFASDCLRSGLSCFLFSLHVGLPDTLWTCSKSLSVLFGGRDDGFVGVFNVLRELNSQSFEYSGFADQEQRLANSKDFLSFPTNLCVQLS